MFLKHQHNIHGQPIKNPIDKIYKASAPSAVHTYEHTGSNQPKCHIEIRDAIFKRLWDWLLGRTEREALMMWLYGAAGAGKSAIAYDFAERCAAAELLLGDFFFSASDATRANIKPFVATIAVQVMRSRPSIRSEVESAACRDPGILDLPFEQQLEKLIIHPLCNAEALKDKPLPQLIIVDGLDECQDTAIQQRVVTSLLSLAKEMNRQGFLIRILIASQPEDHLITTFNSPTACSILSRIPLNKDRTSSSEIRLFVTDKLRVIENKHRVPPTWPGDDAIETLVRKASGQLIYAKLAVNFIVADPLGPLRALDIVLGLQVPPAFQDMPFAELDGMYRYILLQYGDVQIAKLILGLRLITAPKVPPKISGLGIRPLSFAFHGGLKTTRDIASLLNIERAEVSSFVKCMSSVIEESENNTLVVHDASLVDFIQDPSRSGDFHVDSGLHHSQLSILFLRRLMDSTELKTKGCPQEFELFLTLATPTTELQLELHNFFNTLFAEKAIAQSKSFWEIVTPIFALAQRILGAEDHRALQATFDYFLDQDLAPISSWSTNGRAYLICMFSLGKFSGILRGILPQSKDSVCKTLRSFETHRGQAYIMDFLCNRSQLSLPPPSPGLFTAASHFLLDTLFESLGSLPSYQLLMASDFKNIALFIQKASPSDELAQKINRMPANRKTQPFVDYLHRCSVVPNEALYDLVGQTSGASDGLWWNLPSITS